MRQQQFVAVLVSMTCFAGLVFASGDNPASVRLLIPANAEVWFDGNKMSETGTVRDYAPPAALVPGSQYTYQVRVRCLKNGQPVDETRKVIVRAGAVTTVDFAEAVPMATGGSGELAGKVTVNNTERFT